MQLYCYMIATRTPLTTNPKWRQLGGNGKIQLQTTHTKYIHIKVNNRQRQTNTTEPTKL